MMNNSSPQKHAPAPSYPAAREHPASEAKTKKIFVGGLPHDLEEHEFEKYFE